MYLKCIEVQGFKSFANKIRFEFRNGITGIVGPNGSGKSNVADAIRWVFGEQSAKQLRGSSMQDVIFAGTQLRKPQSYASVSITLDNSDRALAMDSDEVTVTRKVFRSGESEYLLNGSGCRLKDISELFYDTGIGKEGYSLIGQGQVEKILSGKAEERRELFDEACGIVKFKKRKLTAVRRLESEHASMLRVTDILTELERQVGPLSKQAGNAKEYLRLRGELKVYDVNAFLIDQAQTEGSLKKFRADLSVTENDLDTARREDGALRERYSFLDDSLRELEAKLSDLRGQLREAEETRSGAENRVNLLSEQLRAGNEGLSLSRSREAAVSARKREKEESIRSSLTERSENAELLLALNGEKSAALKRQEELELRLELMRKALANAQGKSIDLINEKSEIRARLTALETLISQNSLRKEEQHQRLQELRRQAEEFFALAGKTEEEKKSLQRQLNQKSGDGEKLRSEEEEAERNFNEAQRKLLETGQKYQIVRGRYETLRGMAERYEGFNSAVKRVMDERRNYPGIIGVVSDIIRVKPEYQTAIETALGGSIQNIVVKTESDAKKLVGFLKENRAGRATFLPLDSITPREAVRNERLLREPGVLGTADTLVSADPEFSRVIRFLLEHVLVVDTLDHAAAAARKYHYSVRMVTLDGELLAAGGSITGGAFRGNTNILSRGDELLKLEKQSSELRSAQEELTKQVSRMKQLRESARTELQELQEELRALTVREAAKKTELDSVNRSLILLSAEEKEIKPRIQELSAEQEKAERERSEILSSMELLKQADSDSLSSVSEARQLADQAESELNAQREKVQELSLAIASSEQRDSFLLSTEERLSSELASLSEELNELAASESVALLKIEECRAGIASEEENARRARSRASELSDSVKLLEKKKEEFTSSQREFFDRRDSLNSRISDLTREQLRLGAQIEKAEEKLDAQTEYLWSEYELTPSEAERYLSEDLKGQSNTQIRRRASELKGAIRALGSVNVNAIDQYKEVSERYEFLKKQYDDLKKAEEDLSGIINDLDQGMRKQFTAQFAAIREEYDRVFRELFGGGAGTLTLQEGADVIDSDISIISQPPGKKLQNMMQLSGGEKALSAIALLFAIQNLKPSPFALLDEIEAALDDSNVGRFTNYLRRLSEHNGTQFIVITHRRGTMVAADRLYGITMQEKGVSALVSVNLVEQELDN